MIRQTVSIAVKLSSVVIFISIFTRKSAEDLLIKRSTTRYDTTRPSVSITGNNIISFDTFVAKNTSFNDSVDNLFVLLHIQKTGGTSFEKHLVEDLAPELPCQCIPERRRCKCPRNGVLNGRPRSVAEITWLVSRFSTGWVCGLHPDYTQLKRCLSQEKNILFLTFLRHPLYRFVSEFRHVRRGATWKISKIHCKQHDTQLCFGNKTDWSDVSLDEFIDCKSNMAINRQTKMLANLEDKIMCNSSPITDTLLLSSAMSNLERLAYFGICEQQRISQLLFERTFKLKFSGEFTQSEDNKTKVFIAELSPVVRDRIMKLNDLDMKLYNFAIDLFANRYGRLT